MCLARISASIMSANMWKNSLKNIESDANKILYETLLDFVLQRNGSYFRNKQRTKYVGVRSLPLTVKAEEYIP